LPGVEFRFYPCSWIVDSAYEAKMPLCSLSLELPHGQLLRTDGIRVWPVEPTKTRRRMARERRGAGSSVVSIETLYYKTIY
jgi:hypothetical protein